MKKTIIILGIILLILLLLFFVFLRAGGNKIINNSGSNITPTLSLIKIDEDEINIDNPEKMDPITIQKLQEQQTIDDFEYAQKQQEVYDTYPWLDTLPLNTDTYFIYFKVEDKKFYGQIYNKENEEAQKTEIINALRNAGIPVESYEIVWE